MWQKWIQWQVDIYTNGGDYPYELMAQLSGKKYTKPGKDFFLIFSDNNIVGYATAFTVEELKGLFPSYCEFKKIGK